MATVSRISSSSSNRLAAAGWLFFIGENALLSENRTWLIEELGDDRYHLVYGACSTLATASIGYSYYKISRQYKIDAPLKARIPRAAGGWAILSMGLILASQAAPRMQIPFALVAQSDDGPNKNQSSTSTRSLQVRCPFDFSDKKFANDPNPRGVERISRHSGLWSFGFVGLGQALLVPPGPLQLWWMGPAAVALLGGAHTDSRFRRGMGGNLPPEYDCQTSNVPFWALISGQQGSQAWLALTNELKPLNAGAAVLASTLWVLRKLR